MNTIETMQLNEAPQTTTTSLRRAVTDTVDRYLSQVGVQNTVNLYNMVLAEVEDPLLDVLLRHVRGNQSRAARVLGINRGTLRKKLKQYGRL